MSTIGLAIVSRSFSRVGKTTCTGSAPITSSSTARIPTPGLIFCSAATTYIQNHTGSLSEGSTDSQPNRWSSSAPRDHCASNVVLPQPAGALSRVSLQQRPADNVSSRAARRTGGAPVAGTGSLVASKTARAAPSPTPRSLRPAEPVMSELRESVAPSGRAGTLGVDASRVGAGDSASQLFSAGSAGLVLPGNRGDPNCRQVSPRCS